ncbi:MAG: hypothetical protein DBX37_06945 [Massilioclostridium sp.]|nr:MAG: hypothetical protein DBX37_06945 [Massilioclostridium sp.]
MEKELIIVFTYRYPYNPPTEQFFDIEMEYWLREEVDIVIVPIARDYNISNTYDRIPNNKTKVIPLKRESRIKEVFIAALKCPDYLGSLIHDFRRLDNCVEKNHYYEGVKYTLQQYLQGESLFQDIKKQIPITKLSGYSRIILYSYWFNSVATSIAFYKKYLKSKGIKNVIAVSRAHGDGDLYVKGMKCYRPSLMILSSNFDKVFSVSENGIKYLKKQGIDNVELARLGVKEGKKLVRNTNRDYLQIVSCSVINENKRVIKIAEALKQITDIKIRWTHFGNGPLEENLKIWCENNLGRNIQYVLNGYTQNSDIRKFYIEETPDLFINVSIMEGIPVSIMEAMSYSIPTIATNVGATSEIVEENVNGYLIPQLFEVDVLKELLVGYWNTSSPEIEQLRLNAYNCWKSKYNADLNFGKFVQNNLVKNENNNNKI